MSKLDTGQSPYFNQSQNEEKLHSTQAEWFKYNPTRLHVDEQRTLQVASSFFNL